MVSPEPGEGSSECGSTSEERHHRRAMLLATQYHTIVSSSSSRIGTVFRAVASVSSLTWRTRTDRTTVEDFERELALGSSKVVLTL